MPANPAEAREKAAKQCVIYAEQRGISPEWRHELAVAFFGEPSTKKLALEQLRTLYRLLVRLSNDRAKEESPEAFAGGFTAWLEYQVDKETDNTKGLP